STTVPVFSQLMKSEKTTVISSRVASRITQSMEDQAGPRDEAYGLPVKKPWPALFLYRSPTLSFICTPNGDTVTALNLRAFRPSKACVISALEQFCDMAQDDIVFKR